jgi:hypothetical protein
LLILGGDIVVQDAAVDAVHSLTALQCRCGSPAARGHARAQRSSVCSCGVYFCRNPGRNLGPFKVLLFYCAVAQCCFRDDADSAACSRWHPSGARITDVADLVPLVVLGCSVGAVLFFGRKHR